jgi:hypothetical protein
MPGRARLPVNCRGPLCGLATKDGFAHPGKQTFKGSRLPPERFLDPLYPPLGSPGDIGQWSQIPRLR